VGSQFVLGSGIGCINEEADNRNPEMDGKWNAAMYFFPANPISDEQLMIVESRLKQGFDCIRQ